MTGPSAAVGYWCGNVAYEQGGSGMWWLGWNWCHTPQEAVRWLATAAVLMAEQLGPQARHAVRVWADTGGSELARLRLEDGRPTRVAVSEEGIRYEVSVEPIDFPPLLGLDAFAAAPASAHERPAVRSSSPGSLSRA